MEAGLPSEVTLAPRVAVVVVTLAEVGVVTVGTAGTAVNVAMTVQLEVIGLVVKVPVPLMSVPLSTPPQVPETEDEYCPIEVTEKTALPP